MPKGQSPSKRMDARRSRIESEIERYSGSDLPMPSFEEGDKPSLMDRGMARALREVTGMRQGQLEEMNREGLSRRREKLEQIDVNRENEAARSSMARRKMGYKKGGKVDGFPDLNKDGKVTKADVLKGRGVEGFMGGGMVRGCKSAQTSGKGFKGTY